MKTISVEKCYEIYDDALQTFDQIPPQTYAVRFSKQSGFFLEKHSDLSVGQTIYGVHLEKADKLLHACSKFDRSLGVILSGNRYPGRHRRAVYFRHYQLY